MTLTQHHYSMRWWVRLQTSVCCRQEFRGEVEEGRGLNTASCSIKVGQLFPVKLMDTSWACYWQLIRKQLARNISSLKTDGVARNESLLPLNSPSHPLTHTHAHTQMHVFGSKLGEKMAFSRTDQSLDSFSTRTHISAPDCRGTHTNTLLTSPIFPSFQVVFCFLNRMKVKMR